MRHGNPGPPGELGDISDTSSEVVGSAFPPANRLTEEANTLQGEYLFQD